MNKIIKLLVLVLVLQGCASSNVSRRAEGQVQSTYATGSSLFNGADNASLAEAYQSTSQRTKGILWGGATGAVVGGVASGSAGILPGAAGGAIFGGALGAYIDANSSLADQIINRGNKVIVLGDQILIVLPSWHLFNNQTAELRSYAYETLNLVSKLIAGCPNILVKVSAYTSATGPERINRALSQEQANSIVRYLWRTGINTRLLYGAGYGGMRPVEKPVYDWTSSENYRIEITLEKLPV